MSFDLKVVHGRVLSWTPSPAPPPPPAPASTSAPRPLTEDEIFARESLDQLNGTQPLGDAFFDYDSATIRPDAQANIAKDAT